MSARPLLGEVLQRLGAIDQATLFFGLQEQRRHGGRLGERLVLSGRLTHPQLAEALAKQAGYKAVNLRLQPVDPSLSVASDLSYYLRLQVIPWQRGGEGQMRVAAVESTPAARAFTRLRFGSRAQLVLTSPRDWRFALEQRFGNELESHARYYLWKRLPRFSARRQPADSGTLVALLLIGLLALLSPFWQTLHAVVLVLANLFFLGTLALRAVLIHVGDRPLPEIPPLEDEADLPVYTVLVPLYRETRILPRLLAALDALDYPKEKLDVKLILEEDDVATYEAACRARPPTYIEILRVPPSKPRTKPKACNYALQFARGQYITIYDAEDRPDPKQLKKAVATFRHLPPEVACLQARLDYDNRHDNGLTRLFSIEYGILFSFLIPGLHRLGIPIPLGGTSNHLKAGALRWLGEWDPYNVTEDADLGLRLAAAGYRTAPLNSVTMEEAPLTFKAWICQRARWIKGYLVTWTVHNRDATELKSKIGLRAFWALQFFLGGASLIYLLAPLLWVQAFAWLILPAGAWPPLPLWITLLSLTTLGLGIALQWISATKLVMAHRWRGMDLAVALFPFYWLLHSVAAVRATWQLFRDPYRWDKTEHGLSQKQTVYRPSGLTYPDEAVRKAPSNV